MKKILIVEDDADLREGIAFSMQTEGYAVLTAHSLHTAKACIRQQPVDLVLLDCNLPDGSGFDLCTAIKKEKDLPILMLTARDTEMDEVKALELGMDDFMSKPFSLAVLKARIKKLLQKAEPVMQLVSGGICIDKNQCKIYQKDKELVCSRIEYQVLVYLVEHAGIVLSKEQILAHVWDSQGRFVDENAVAVNIRRLRLKIEEDPKHPVHIRTVHGIGYIWKEK
ncbi:MAG: response regulator transcription factor [Eubacterium sp.]|nr:response regulator transcription factor [Eubacterium sp.]